MKDFFNAFLLAVVGFLQPIAPLLISVQLIVLAEFVTWQFVKKKEKPSGDRMNIIIKTGLYVFLILVFRAFDIALKDIDVIHKFVGNFQSLNLILVAILIYEAKSFGRNMNRIFGRNFFKETIQELVDILKKIKVNG